MDNINEGKNILVVDDDTIVLEFLSVLIKEYGYNAVICPRPEEAMAMITTNNINTVLTDIKMPRISGIQLLREFRRFDPEIPVILITAYADINYVVSSLKEGAFDFIFKPFNPEILMNSLEKAVEFHRLRQIEKNYTKSLEETLKKRTQEITQKNIALGEILGRLEIEKKQVQGNIIANVENLLLPVIQKLKIEGDSQKYLDLLKKNIEELTSPFGLNLTKKKYKLSPREIEICNMIKSGLTSKEISKLLNISLRTIEKHRDNIRNKLGITKNDANLSSFLKAFLRKTPYI